MKSLTFFSVTLFTLLTAVQPIWAEDEPELILNPRLNTLLGVSQIGAEGRNPPGGLSGGALVELGSEWHTLETGALVMRTGRAREASVTLPMYAKFRVINMTQQSWFVKAGAMTAFESNGFNVLAGLGAGGRIAITPNLDLIIDATYNRGLLDSSTTEPGTNRVGGILFLTGLSFRI